MSNLDSAENAMWREKARDVADRVLRPLAKKYDELQEYPWEIRDALAEAGLMGAWIAPEYGGKAGDTPVLDLCIIVEEIAKADPAIGVLFAVNALGSFPIIVGGTEEQKQRFLPSIAKGEKLCAFCLSEKTAGSDAQGLKVRAVPTGEDTWKIHGEKNGPQMVVPLTSIRFSRLPTPPAVPVASRPSSLTRPWTAFPSARSKTRWASARYPW